VNGILVITPFAPAPYFWTESYVYYGSFIKFTPNHQQERQAQLRIALVFLS